MKKNIIISDSLDNINEAELENIEVNKRIPFGVSLKRIKKLAFENIDINTDTVKSAKAEKSKRMLRLAVIIPAAAILLAFSVIAVSNIDILRMLFPDSYNLLDGKILTVNAEVVQNGVKMAITQTVFDGEAAGIAFEFTNVDGSEFPEGTQANDFDFTGENIFYSVYNETNCVNLLSEDKKTLYGYARINFNSVLSSQDIVNIKVKDLNIVTTGKKVADYNIKQLTENKNAYNPLPDIIPGFTLNKTSFDGEKLYIEFANIKSETDPNKLISNASIQSLEDTQTEDVIYSDDRNYNDEVSIFNISPYNLSNYKPVIVYNKVDTVIKGEWSVNINLKVTDTPVRKDVNAVFYKDGNKFVINDVTSSVLGIRLRGFSFNENIPRSPSPTNDDIRIWFRYNSDVYLLHKDGSKSKVYLSLSKYYKGMPGYSELVMNFTPIKIVDITDFKKSEKFYLTGNNNTDYQELINTNDVTDLVIEGVKIPLK